MFRHPQISHYYHITVCWLQSLIQYSHWNFYYIMVIVALTHGIPWISHPTHIQMVVPKKKIIIHHNYQHYTPENAWCVLYLPLGWRKRWSCKLLWFVDVHSNHHLICMCMYIYIYIMCMHLECLSIYIYVCVSIYIYTHTFGYKYYIYIYTL